VGTLADERESFDAMMRETFGAPPAVRQLDPALISDPGFQRRYAAETGVLRGLDEPWLAVTTSFVVDGAGRIVATMRPQVSGPTLAALLERNPHGLDAQTTAAIAMDVLSALSALHARGVAHRGNLVEHVIVGLDGTCVLVDEGLAPRWPNESTQAAVAADLRSFADLIARCLGSHSHSRRGRPTPPRVVRSANSGPGVARWIPRPTANPLRPLATHASDLRTPSVDTAAALLTELGSAAARAFEPDWDMQARERLAVVSQAFAASAPMPALPAMEPPADEPDPLSLGYVSIWPLPRPIRLALIVAAVVGATISFLIAIQGQNSSSTNPNTPTTPQAIAIAAPSASASASASANGVAPTQPQSSASASVSPSPSQSTAAPLSSPTTVPAVPPSAPAPGTTATVPVSNPVGAVANAGFETGSLAGWNCSSTDSVVTSPVHSGNFALRGAANNSDDAQCSQTINVAPGRSYTLSGWVNGSYVFIGVSGTGSRNDPTMWTSGTNGSYTRLSIGFTTGSSSVTIYVHGWYAQGTYFADDITLS
jgi:serine/threonine protein kinase